MPVSTADEIGVGYLAERSLTDLLDTADREGEPYVESFLAEALEVANAYLTDHGKRLDAVPDVEYDPWQSGVTFDPYHGSGEVLIVGGPRGILQGGYQVLKDRGFIDRTSLLNILTKGLIHSYHQQLVDEHFELGRSVGRAEAAGIDLYDEYRMLVPAVDEGFAQLFSLHVDGDITDDDLRKTYISEWIEWYRELTDLDVELFGAVAYAVSDRAAGVEGDARETINEAMRIQEPLVRNADVSVIAARLD